MTFCMMIVIRHSWFIVCFLPHDFSSVVAREFAGLVTVRLLDGSSLQLWLLLSCLHGNFSFILVVANGSIFFGALKVLHCFGL